MRALLVAGLMLFAMLRLAAADEVIVTRPGIMCNSTRALAQLTLPDGDSRTHRETIYTPKYLDIARRGECRDLQIGQKLGVLKTFRNTVVVSLEDKIDARDPGVFVAPVIDFDPVPAAPTSGATSSRPNQVGEAGRPIDLTSDPILDVPIGMAQADFTRIHGHGRCVGSMDGGTECYYAGTDRADCPGRSACYATVYEFLHGSLVAFHTQFVLETDWLQLYRLTMASLGPPVAAVRTWGTSSSFDTNTGVLEFARKNGPPASWHVTLSYRPSAGTASN